MPHQLAKQLLLDRLDLLAERANLDQGLDDAAARLQRLLVAELDDRVGANDAPKRIASANDATRTVRAPPRRSLAVPSSGTKSLRTAWLSEAA